MKKFFLCVVLVLITEYCGAMQPRILPPPPPPPPPSVLMGPLWSQPSLRVVPQGGALEAGLINAAKKGALPMVKRFLRSRARLGFFDQYGRNELHWAVIGGNIEIVKALLFYAQRITGNRNISVYINRRSAKGLMPIHLAAAHGHLDIAGLLVLHKARFAYQACGFIAQQFAACHGRDSICRFLKYCAEVTIVTAAKRTHLHLAVCNRDEEIIRMLVRVGFSFHQKDVYGLTPFDYARKNGLSREILDLLRGPTTGRFNRQGRMPREVSPQQGQAMLVGPPVGGLNPPVGRLNPPPPPKPCSSLPPLGPAALSPLPCKNHANSFLSDFSSSIQWLPCDALLSHMLLYRSGPPLAGRLNRPDLDAQCAFVDASLCKAEEVDSFDADCDDGETLEQFIDNSDYVLFIAMERNDELE